MFPEDLPGHKTKPEQESPSASRPTNESFFARMLFACVTDSCMCYCGGFSALDFGEGQFFSANMSFVKARFQRWGVREARKEGQAAPLTFTVGFRA